MIPKTMKAAVVQGYGQPLKIEEVPVREPGRYEVLVKVIACGVCHTDLHAVDGDWPAKPKIPLIPGHEGVGIVGSLRPRSFCKRRRCRRSSMAVQCMWMLRLLYYGMGNPL